MEAAFRTALAKGGIGLVDCAPVPTLRRFVDEEFEPWVKALFTDKPKTLAYYVNGLRRLAGFDGLWSVKLDDITGDRIADMFASDARRCPSPASRELQVLRRTLKLA